MSGVERNILIFLILISFWLVKYWLCHLVTLSHMVSTATVPWKLGSTPTTMIINHRAAAPAIKGWAEWLNAAGSLRVSTQEAWCSLAYGLWAQGLLPFLPEAAMFPRRLCSLRSLLWIGLDLTNSYVIW